MNVADEWEKKDNLPPSCSCPTNRHSWLNESFESTFKNICWDKQISQRVNVTVQKKRILIGPSKRSQDFVGLKSSAWPSHVRLHYFPSLRTCLGSKSAQVASLQCACVQCALDALTTWFTVQWLIVKWLRIRSKYQKAKHYRKMPLKALIGKPPLSIR